MTAKREKGTSRSVKVAPTRYNTNLASEFYVISALHRLGVNVLLTLGNKKSVDLVITTNKGDVVNVDVKGLAGKTGWPVDNVGVGSSKHFIAFVCFGGKISNLDAQPEVWIVPSQEIEQVIYTAPKGRRIVQVKKLRDDGVRFKEAWHLIAKY